MLIISEQVQIICRSVGIKIAQFVGYELYALFSLTSQRNFPISFKPKVAIAKFIGKMQKKSGIMKSGLDAMPLFLLDNLLKIKNGM